jgi:hypothetical protein
MVVTITHGEGPPHLKIQPGQENIGHFLASELVSPRIIAHLASTEEHKNLEIEPNTPTDAIGGIKYIRSKKLFNGSPIITQWIKVKTKDYRRSDIDPQIAPESLIRMDIEP